MKTIVKPFIAVFASFLLNFSATAGTTQKGTTLFDAQSFTLDNGLEVIVIPSERAPVVHHMLWYKVGAADESPGQSGIAHFLEHLMFKGSENYPQGVQSEFIAHNGGDENAFTSFDQTAYFQTIASEHLPTLMEMEADRMRGVLLSPKEIESERKVIIEEREQRVGNNPGSKLSEAMMQALYYNHPYGVPVIGWRHEIETLTIEQIRDFYRHWYSPNNAVLIVAGDVTKEQVRVLAEQSYGTIAPLAKVPIRKRALEPEHHMARRVALVDPRVGATQILMRYLAPTYHKESLDHFSEGLRSEAIDVLAQILGGDANSRLNRILVEETKIAAAAGAYYDSVALDYGAFSVYIVPASGIDSKTAESALEAELEKLVREGVSEEEVSTAKKRMLIDLVYAQDSLTAAPRTIGRILTTGGNLAYLQGYPEALSSVTLKDVQLAASVIFDTKRRVIASMHPEKTQL